ncbi:9114_t:CDS:1, partial [Cetraspora pellucida]
ATRSESSRDILTSKPEMGHNGWGLCDIHVHKRTSDEQCTDQETEERLLRKFLCITNE